MRLNKKETKLDVFISIVLLSISLAFIYLVSKSIWVTIGLALLAAYSALKERKGK